MAFDFPATPAPYEQYTYGTSTTYTWIGYAWMIGAISEPPPDVPEGRKDDDPRIALKR